MHHIFGEAIEAIMRGRTGNGPAQNIKGGVINDEKNGGFTNNHRLGIYIGGLRL